MRENARPRGRPGGMASVTAGVAAVAVAGLEVRRMRLGFDDADDPQVMLAFFREHPQLYTATGVLWLLVGLAVVVAAVSLWQAVLAAQPGLMVSVGSVFGLVSGAFFFAQGALRLQSPGTILHIASLDEESGEAAYAAVQMAGTQGFGSAGGYALAIWATAVALGTWRSRALPRLVPALAVLPATFLFLGLVNGLYAVPEQLYLPYLAAVVAGLPLWCLGLGIALLRLESPGRP